MDKNKFAQAYSKVMSDAGEKNTIGTLREKTLHAVLKHYFEPCVNHHEVRVGQYVADIAGETGIIEIQTANFNKLRNKLGHFLEITDVTLVYPMPSTKWLIWIDESTGDSTHKRKSPKKGCPMEAFFELYKIKQFISNKHFKFRIVMTDIEEYRSLNGWSKDRKKGSSRLERIPVDIVDEITIDTIHDYTKLLPQDLPEVFTSKDLQKSAGIKMRYVQTALNVLHYIGAVKRVGKNKNAFLYEIQN